MNLTLGLLYAALGIGLVLWAAPLSLRYNAWTTNLRQRYPHINPPPTAEWRSWNTRIMTILFRVFGAFLFVLSIMYIVPLLGTSHR